MQVINHARDVLLDKRKREIYDKYGYATLRSYEQYGEVGLFIFNATSQRHSSSFFIDVKLILNLFFSR